MSMNKFNDLNEWEDDYYSHKHRSRTVTTGYAFYLAVIAVVFILLFLLFSCNRTAYTQAPQPERVACDTLIDRMTGERIPVYNCGETWR